MAENQKQPLAESHQEVNIKTKTRSLTRNQQGKRNYPILQTGKEIIQRNYNGIKQIINRNYRRLSY